MAGDRRIVLLILWFSVFYVKNASTKIVEGTLSTKEVKV